MWAWATSFSWRGPPELHDNIREEFPEAGNSNNDRFGGQAHDEDVE
jgi:hypothetical protein